jgi:hypothetical protein
MQKLFKLHCILEHKLKANQKKNQTFCDIIKKKIIVMVESSFILFGFLENKILNTTHQTFQLKVRKKWEKQRKFTLPNFKSFFIGSLTCSICTWIHFTFVWCPFSRLIWTIFKSFSIICSLFFPIIVPKKLRSRWIQNFSKGKIRRT